MDVQINLLAVFIAGLSSMVVGSIWYLPKVFGGEWSKLTKVDLKKKVNNSDMAIMLGATFVISLITAYVLAYFSYISYSFFDETFLRSSLTTALLVWLGFNSVRFMTHDMFEGRRKKLTLINISNELVTILVMALIIGMIGV